MKKYALFIMLCILYSAPLHAASPTHQLIKERSSLGFTSTVNGKVVEGKFTDYDAVIMFDPAQPQNGSIRVTVKLAPHTVQVEDKRAAQNLLGGELAAMGDLGIFIPATFVSNEIERISDQDFRGRGVLSVMGRKQVINYQFLMMDFGEEGLLANDADTVTFTTYFDLNRAAYGKFKGERAAGYTISDKVTITANLVTRKIAPKP
jgi:polyisoprenoid-binding protein YceI